MSNSSLVSYTNLTKNYNTRNHAIDKITIHHMSGNMTAKSCADYFATTDREVSSNYCIGSDGKIAMSVEEKNRSWCSSSPSNDHRAVTIEVANCKGAPNWEVSDKAMASLINLCVDICKRNNIKKLNFTGNTSGNLTMHCYFANTDCPGKYLKSKFPYIASEVNKRLGATTSTTQPTTKPTTPTTTKKNIKVGTLVSIAKNAYYYNGQAVPTWVSNQKWYVSSIKGDRAVIDKNEKGTNSICSPINVKYLTIATKTATTTKKVIKVGSTVKIKNGAKTYDGKSLMSFVYGRKYKVKEISGNRVVLTFAGVVVCAMHKSNLILV